MSAPALNLSFAEIRHTYRTGPHSLGEMLAMIYTGGSCYQSAVGRIVLALQLDDDQRVDMEREFEDMGAS